MNREPLLLAVTNAPLALLHGLSVALSPLSTTPIPRRKGRTRHERHLEFARKRGRFRLELGVVAPALRLHLTPFRPLRLPLSRRQLQTETLD